jgi:LemA protein
MNANMLKWLVPLLAIVLLAWGALNSYNGLVDKEEAVSASWADVQSQYQRRLDLIPNLVSTVQGYADFEQSTLIAVTEARAAALGALSSSRPGGDLSELDRTGTVLTGAVRGLLGYAETYPELKANENFIDLQSQLEGTENRIAVARTRYNETVLAYNKGIKRFPGNLWASIFGFEESTYFEAADAAETAPKVSFE